MGFCSLGICICTEFKISLQDFEYAVCLYVGVSDFVLNGKDPLQSEFLSSVTLVSACALCRIVKQNKGFDTSNHTRSEK